MTSDSELTDGRIHLTIVGGFLGAGKSTWLRHQLFVNTYAQPEIIVNELADNAVDDTLLHRAKSLHVLSGGCACCDQKDQMKTLLHQICNDRTRSERNSNCVRNDLIFEMSGVANPANVLAVIQNDALLARHIVLHEIIVVVDAVNALDQLDTELLARQQIEAADRLLITKTNLCGQHQLSELMSTLMFMSPGTDISYVSYGEPIAIPPLTRVGPRELKILGSESQLPLKSLQLKLSDNTTSDLEWADFTVWLSAMLHKHGDEMVRVKGVVRTPGGRLLLQSVRKSMQSPEVLPKIESSKHQFDTSKDNTIVLIGRGLQQELLDNSLKAFLCNS